MVLHFQKHIAKRHGLLTYPMSIRLRHNSRRPCDKTATITWHHNSKSCDISRTNIRCKVNGYTFRGGNPAIFILSLLSRDRDLKERSSLLRAYSFFKSRPPIWKDLISQGTKTRSRRSCSPLKRREKHIAVDSSPS